MSNNSTGEKVALGALLFFVGLAVQAFFIGLAALALAVALPLVLDYIGVGSTSNGFPHDYGVGLAISLVIWFGGWCWRAPAAGVNRAKASS